MVYNIKNIDISYYWEAEMIEITRLRHAYPEKEGFFIKRPSGLAEYTFLHFYNSVEIYMGGEWITTEPHSVILYDKWTPQHFRSREALIHDWMHFRGDATEIFTKSKIQCDKIYYLGSHSFITKIVAEMETEFNASEKNKTDMMQLKFQELFLKLGRAILNDNAYEVSKETKQQFRYLRGKMFSSLEENWTVSRMAEIVGLSESRLYALYKELYGISPNADLILARINAAKNMLTIEKKKTVVVAEELGYQNTTHFIRQFKKHTGMTPSDYKANH